MAYVNDNIITSGLRGKVGDMLVFRRWGDKTIVSRAPGKHGKGKSTARQAGTRDNFQQAAWYAKSILKKPDQSIAQAYATVLRPRQNVYSRALEDFMSPPVVSIIDAANYQGAAGDLITIRATDDFRVTRVQVEIYAANGTPLEAGNAVQNINGLDWTYTALQANNLLVGTTIKAIATDVPGNKGTLEVMLP